LDQCRTAIYSQVWPNIAQYNQVWRLWLKMTEHVQVWPKSMGVYGQVRLSMSKKGHLYHSMVDYGYGIRLSESRYGQVYASIAEYGPV